MTTCQQCGNRWLQIQAGSCCLILACCRPAALTACVLPACRHLTGLRGITSLRPDSRDMEAYEDGMGPDSRLRSKRRYVRLVRVAMSSGNVPVRLFSADEICHEPCLLVGGGSRDGDKQVTGCWCTG